MNHSTTHTGNGRYARHGPKRPASIAELAEIALQDSWDGTKEFIYYLRIAEKCRKEGKECARKGDLEGAFVELARAATLVLETLPMHRDYNGILTATQRQNLSLNGQDILVNLSDIKPALVDRYEKWLQKYPDGVEHEYILNARTQKMTREDTPARAQAIREQFQAEERTRQELRDKWKRKQLQAQDDVERRARTTATASAAALEAQDANPPDYMFSRSAAEAVKRKWQQQQLAAQDDVEEPQRTIAPAAAANTADYTFSRNRTIVASSDAFPPEEANPHHKSSSGATSHGSQPVDHSSTFYTVDHEDGPESLTPNANQTVHLPPENSQLDTAPWILSSRKRRGPKRPTDLQFMTRMANLRQQTDGSSITSSTPQVEQMYLLGTPASFVSSFSQSFSIASTPPPVEFPPTPVFTDERIF